MDVRLTDEQAMLRETAAAVARELAPRSVDDLRTGATAPTDAAGWRRLVDLGLIGMQIPEALGGGGAGVVEAALVAEQLGGSLVGLPYVGCGAWVPAVLAAAGAVEVLEAVLGGELRLAPVLSSDLTDLVAGDGDGVVFDARYAGAGLRIGGDGRLRVVALGEATASVDLTRTLCRVAADSPAVDPGAALGGPLDSPALDRARAVAMALLAADLVGVMQAALDDAVRYVGEREQFGVPVGSFQAVQHLAAHGALLVEAARSCMWHAAWAADSLSPSGALLAARQAKAFCSAAGRDVGEMSMQLFGGIGFTWEHFAHVRQRRILLTREALGAESWHYAAIAAERLGGSVGG